LLWEYKATELTLVNPNFTENRLNFLSKDILQAARVRIYKTEYISCPSCGRTLFNLEETVHKVKAATSHLTGLKIAVMGCIVNGPGEMADADYGYVGAGRDRVSLYRGKECILKNIPQEEAVEQLLALIENDKSLTTKNI
jgi:(E)-4-hydroxy-3-methylbut-2-enyl-diphosphate synthase